MIYLDFETYSAELDLRTAGTYRYADSCEPIVLAWAVDDGPVRVIDLTDPVQAQGSPMQGFWDALTGEGLSPIVAHNAMFDRLVLRRLTKMPGGFTFNERWHCTMAQALSHSLPGGLDKLCQVLQVDTDKAKDAEGKKLIQLFCKPRPKNMKLRRATRHTHPQEWARFLEYARLDVAAMREVYHKLPRWNWRTADLEAYRLDQRINDRGIAIDVAFAGSAVEAVAQEQQRLDARAREQTAGAVSTLGQRDKMLAHILEEYGVDLPDMQASTLERRIDDHSLPPELKSLLALRLKGATTSTAKYKALARATGEDGRLRGTLQFRGASRTGRWAGRIFQPQNLPRPLHDFAEIVDFIEASKAGATDLLFGEEVMGLASSSIRSAIWAPPGRKLLVADLSNIEGRVCAWVAGEAWKLAAFQRFDAGEGPDLYKVAYGASFKVDPETVTKAQRQIGKVQELMLQYEGGVGAFLTGAATYGIDLDEMAWKALPEVPADVVEEARGFLDWCHRQKRPTFGLGENTFLACESLKRLWRRSHPRIVALWGLVRDAWHDACAHPGTWFVVGRLHVRKDRAWLRIVLPSGRALCYPDAKVHEGGSCSYLGVNQYTRKWQKLNTHGGKLVENIVQAIAYDVLCEGMKAAEARGIEVVLTVHDEIVAEVADGAHSADDLAAAMTAPISWAEGLPLAAAGFETQRYRKEG